MATWLDLVHNSTSRALVNTRWIDQIMQGMSYPTTQYPFLIYFLGNAIACRHSAPCSPRTTSPAVD
ncbi:hypothetical protein BJX61DRAFT_524550 [Aspergillus egyptiacus]|nr:hypothetical protein BJX61DRAFT_524550 [Aspergillus egyptiacus]